MDDFKLKADDIVTVPCDDCGKLMDRAVKQLRIRVWICGDCKAERIRRRNGDKPKGDDIVTILCGDCGKSIDRMVKQLRAPKLFCSECRRKRARESQKERRAANPEAVRERARERYWKDVEKHRERGRRHARGYRRRNQEKIKEKRKESYWANPEKFRKDAIEQYRNNPEVSRARAKRERETNPERVRERLRRWRKANPEKLRKAARVLTERRRLGVIEHAELELAGLAPSLKGLTKSQRTTALVRLGRIRQARLEAMAMAKKVSKKKRAM